MKSIGQFVLALLVSLPVGAPNVLAQKIAQTSLSVSAKNVGVFGCTLNTEHFDFGILDAGGTFTGNPNVAAKRRSEDPQGTTFESTVGAVRWGCRSAPKSTINVALISTEADHTGSLAADALEVRIPATHGGISTGYQRFTSQADLITGMLAGNGVYAAFGLLDLRLTVGDADPLGDNTWIVRLRATASP